MNKPLVAIAGVLAVGTIGFLLYRQNSLQSDLAQEQTKTQQLQAAVDAEQAKKRALALQPKWVAATDTLVSESFVVSPEQVREFKIATTDAMRNVRVSGIFSAEGGLNKDIQVFVFEASAYANWKAHRPSSKLYDSVATKVGRIDDVQIPANSGDYYLVFFNPANNFAARAIKADVKIQYERLQESK